MDAATILAGIFEQAFEDAETRAAARDLQLLCEAGEWRAEEIVRSIAAAVDPGSPSRPRDRRRSADGRDRSLDDLAHPGHDPPASEELSGVGRLVEFLAALRHANHRLAAELRGAAGAQQHLAGRARYTVSGTELRRCVEELAAASERTRIAVEGQLIVERFLEIAAKRIEAALLEASGLQGASHADVDALAPHLPEQS